MDREARWSSSQSQATTEPYFFKIIHPRDLKEGTLEIPLKFVNKYGKSLKRHAFLKPPKGTELFLVDLKRSNGRVWLHTGWQDLVARCSISCWYFLLFGYQGQSSFNVLIFDPSCSEIEYPVVEEDDSVEILDEMVVPMANQSKFLTLLQGSSGHGVTSARETASDRAKAFRSTKPHFIVTMQRAYISGNYLHLPIHARSHFYARENKGLSLKGPDGRTWLMEYYYVTKPSQPQVRVGLGWRHFVDGYGLQVGDACAFELINILHTVMEFHVTIFRVDD